MQAGLKQTIKEIEYADARLALLVLCPLNTGWINMVMLIVSRTIVDPANDRCLLGTGEASVLRHATVGNCRFNSKPGVENLVIG